jgi:hypothetical protein
MLKMGIPLPAVKQSLQKEGKDPNIIDMDPDKPLSQIKSAEVPLKDDPEFAKFFKVSCLRSMINYCMFFVVSANASSLLLFPLDA